MNRPRHEFLSGAGLAGYQYCRIGRRNLGNLEEHVFDGIALADYLAKLFVTLELLLQIDVFRLQLVLQLVQFFMSDSQCHFRRFPLRDVDRHAQATNRLSRIVEDDGQSGHDPNRAVILRHPTEIENTLLLRRENLFTLALNSLAIVVVYELDTEIWS